MSKNITIIDKEYKEWIKGLSMRYRRSQDEYKCIRNCPPS